MQINPLANSISVESSPIDLTSDQQPSVELRSRRVAAEVFSTENTLSKHSGVSKLPYNKPAIPQLRIPPKLRSAPALRRAPPLRNGKVNKGDEARSSAENDEQPEGGFSSNYVGNSSANIRHSSSLFLSTSIYESNTHISASSNLFASSTDILEYLRTHPDYQRMPADQHEAIIAAVASGLLITGGVALAIISGGGTTPITVIGTTLLIGTGCTGLQHAISGAINKNFSWSEWGKRTMVSAGLSLITFGAGYGFGGLAGLALLGNGLSESSIHTIGAAVGALVGSGVRTGAFVVIKKIEGKPVETIELILEGVGGGIQGGFAGFLGVKAALTAAWEETIIMSDADRMASLQKAIDQLGEEDLPFFQMVFDRQTTLDVIDHPFASLNRLAIIRGWHQDSHQGAGIIHILSEHPDVAEVFNFSKEQIKDALKGSSDLLTQFTNRFSDMIREVPYGTTIKGLGDHVWKVGDSFIKVGISTTDWSLGHRVVVQANIVSAKDVVPLPPPQFWPAEVFRHGSKTAKIG